MPPITFYTRWNERPSDYEERNDYHFNAYKKRN